MKEPKYMTAAEINSERTLLDSLSSKLTSELIKNGRGRERFSDIRPMTDKLSVDYIAAAEREAALLEEVVLRYGSTISRLPTWRRGFGPRG